MTFKTQAFYFDGQTSAPHKTKLFLDNAGKELKFTTDDGNTIHNSIYDIDYEMHNDKMRIRFKNSEMHIVIDDKNFISEMDNIFNLKVKSSIYRKLLGLKFRTYLLLTLAVFPLIAVLYISATPVIAKKAVSLIPIALDVKLGNLFMEKYIKTIKIDSAKTTLLNEFTNKIIWDNKIELNISVVESNTINAFALPNGNIIIFTGLLNKIDDYETLAALLSHEISHINKRHSMQIMCKSLIGYALVSVLLTDISGLTAVILENTEMLTNLSYSRDMELEADNTGIDLLEKNEINSDGMVKLMKTLQDSATIDVEILSTHPAIEKRIENINSKIKEKKYVRNLELEQIFGGINQQ
jgi:predicted Zn-dependent protease